jgi:glutamate-ammonia-ligase adenylyltransferase
MSPSGSGDFPTTPEPLPAPSGVEEFLRGQIAASPDPPSLIHFLARYQARNGIPADRQQLLILTTLSGQSPFLGELVLQNPDYLPWAAVHLASEENRTAEDLREELARFRFTFSQLSDAAALRRFKYREYVRIALRDFLGKSDLTQTTGALSLLADVLLEEAYRLTMAENLNRYGMPQYHDDSGWLCEAAFAVLALGKLGGGELNYSSDIDLVYVYSREGQTAGSGNETDRVTTDSVISNREFFSKVGEGITRRIGGISAEGQVFRVDLGLRPGGADGELVSSQRAVLSYYRTWARTWEKQALMKVRPCAGDAALGEEVARILKECVDPPGGSALVALEIKEMKDRIDEDLARKGRGDVDLKLGRGGIRELEFAVQALQMTHGRLEPWVHEGNTLRALHRLADKDLVTYGEHASLAQAYTFLRQVEHRLQLERNLQTYQLPSEEALLRSLARRLGFLERDGVEAFLRELDRHRRAVREFYDRVFGNLSQPTLEAAEPDLLLDPLPESALRKLFGRDSPKSSGESVRLFKRIRRLFSAEHIGPLERRPVRRVSSAILQEVASAPEPERALVNLERFLSSMLVEPSARQAFFEKAEWIPPLIQLLAQSEHLSSVLTRHPQIFEDLGGIPVSLHDVGPRQLEERLRKALGELRSPRAAMGALRRFHQREVLFTGLRDIHHQDSLSRTLERLTLLAQTCLQGADKAVAKSLPSTQMRFCILGLGRLGYRELDYNSDLDLIFVMQPGADRAASVDAARQRAESLIHLLTAMTREGSLYSVDLRLRPAGGEGELVQAGAGLLEYFGSTAQTWEKMALLKARAVAGDIPFGRSLIRRVEEMIFRRTPRDTLAREVMEMKEKLEQSVTGSGGEGIPLKLGPGGLMEIHFLIEYLQISHAVPGAPERDTLRMLSDLHARGLLSDADYPTLYAAYLLLRSLDHSLRLLYDRTGDFLPSSSMILNRLARQLSFSFSASRRATGDSLLRLVQESCASVRECFLRSLGV